MKHFIHYFSPITLVVSLVFVTGSARVLTNNFGFGDTYDFIYEKVEPVFRIIVLISLLPIFLFFVMAIFSRKDSWWEKKENKTREAILEKLFYVLGNILKISISVAMVTVVIYMAFLFSLKLIIIFIPPVIFSLIADWRSNKKVHDRLVSKETGSGFVNLS